ncbi:MAG: hypothetical protein LUC43_04975 [Burkholderiales bacterium]|nr:hypothetical protein [Burkholderiales bacterium]
MSDTTTDKKPDEPVIRTPEESQMDVNDLYREEIYTDRKIGIIRALIPIHVNGEEDVNRDTLFTGEAQIMTQMGPIPITFDIDARDLAEAVAMYKEAAKKGVENTVQQLKELRRQEATKLVVPGQPGFPSAGTGGSGIVMP